jgi:hypothetical protein
MISIKDKTRTLRNREVRNNIGRRVANGKNTGEDGKFRKRENIVYRYKNKKERKMTTRNEGEIYKDKLGVGSILYQNQKGVQFLRPIQTWCPSSVPEHWHYKPCSDTVVSRLSKNKYVFQ